MQDNEKKKWARFMKRYYRYETMEGMYSKWEYDKIDKKFADGEHIRIIDLGGKFYWEYNLHPCFISIEITLDDVKKIFPDLYPKPKKEGLPPQMWCDRPGAVDENGMFYYL